jgi:uncharacterized protein (DUF58 family)
MSSADPGGARGVTGGDFGSAAAAAAALGPLRLALARARAGGHHGAHARRAAGQGSEFWQFRAIQPGEALDRIDWRRSAQSDSLYLRQREQEDPVRLWLWLDTSASMDFSSGPSTPTKAGRGRLIAAALAAAAEAAGEHLHLLGAPGQRLSAERLFARMADDVPPLSPAMQLGRGDAVVLVGDFLDGELQQFVSMAASRGAVGVAVAVCDPAEEEFPYNGRVRFEAVEAGEVQHELARAEESRERYLRAWSSHVARLEALDASPGWTCLRHRTDEAPAALLSTAAGWLGGR